MKALNHTGFSSTIKHEKYAKIRGKAEHEENESDKRVFGYTRTTRINEKSSEGKMLRFKKHVNLQTTNQP